MPGRMTGQRWAFVAIAVFVLALGLLAIAARNEDRRGVEGPPLSLHATTEEGGRALFLWLAELGYDTRAYQYEVFDPDPTADALFILAPSFEMSAAASARTLAWVEDGGTLLVVTREPTRVLDDLGVRLLHRGALLGEAVPLQPVFIDPPLATMQADTPVRLDLPETGWTPLLGSGEAGDDPIAAVGQVGAGRVYVLTSEHALSNAGIGQADSAAFALRVLAGVPPGGTILFDEYHHGLTEHATLTRLLAREPWGWAILWTVAFTFAWLAFAGRRFGKAQRQPPSWARRSSGEHVATLGSLLRRGKHDQWLRQHYAAQLKRALGRRHRVRADQPARDFAAALAARHADASELAATLERLEAPGRFDETTTLALMRDAEALRRRMSGSG